jgi:hypothetical protein
MIIYRCVQVHKNVCNLGLEVIVLIFSSLMVLEICVGETWPGIDGLAPPWLCRQDTCADRWAHLE